MRVLIAEGQEFFSAGVRAILEGNNQVEVVGEVQDGIMVGPQVAALRPDVLLVDLSMPGLDGLDGVSQILEGSVRTKVVALCGDWTRTIVEEALKMGICGYILKSGASIELSLAIKAVMRGEVYLSPRITDVLVEKIRGAGGGRRRGAYVDLTIKQRQVLQMIAEGKSNKEMAETLGVVVKTIEAHRAQIGEKLGIVSVAGLTKYAIREGLTGVEH